MRHLTSFVTICLLICFAACKKNSSGNDIPPGNPNNEFKATISASGRPDISIVANGNSTIFGRTIYANGDTSIAAGGSITDHQVVLTLTNIRSAGTYHFVPDSAADPRQSVYCLYTIGNPLVPTAFYSSEHDSTGTVTITSITATHASGSFSVTFSDANGDVLIKNGTFKGDF